jgi:hypothetical protein
MSKFHSIWRLVTQESKLRKSFWVDQTYLTLLSNISNETGHIRYRARHVCWTFSVVMFDDYFERNLLTISLIDLILLPLAS